MRWSQEPGLAVLQTASSVAVVLLQEDALLTAGSKTLGLTVKETLEILEHFASDSDYLVRLETSAESTGVTAEARPHCRVLAAQTGAGPALRTVAGNTPLQLSLSRQSFLSAGGHFLILGTNNTNFLLSLLLPFDIVNH